MVQISHAQKASPGGRLATSVTVDWTAIRREFPALERWTHLNTATFGQIPERATVAIAKHFAHRDELACADFLTWFDDMDRIRGKIGRLISCAAEDVAFVPNAATALGILLGGIRWREGDRVLTLEHEFPNNLYAAGELQHSGVEVVECPPERLFESVNSRTRLVAISSVNYNTGFAPRLEEISEYLRARDVLLYIDGTQSVGALRFDVRRIQPDVLGVHGYKWLLAPNGAGFMYVRPEVREWLRPNAIGWRSHRDWRNVDNLHHGAPEFPSIAEKYEGGMIPFALLYGLEASIDLMLEIGPELIEQRVLGLAGQTRDILRRLGARVEEQPSSIVAAKFDGHDVSALSRALASERVLVAARRGHLRVSPHFYNDETDLQRLDDSLRRLV